VCALSQTENDDGRRNTADVVVHKPRGAYNDYVYDERLKLVRLRAVVHPAESIAEVGEVWGAWGTDGAPLQALVFTGLPTFPGCVVRARVEGALEGRTPDGARHALVFGAAEGGLPQAREELFRAALGAGAHLLGWRPSTKVKWLDVDDASRLLADGRNDYAWQRARERTVRYGAAWKAQPGERGRDGSLYAEPHTWAERMVASLPSRFREYVADELLDDERILAFVDRPPFRPPGPRWGVLLRRQLPEGLLIVTDRQILFMVDAIPPGATMVHWGYIARTTAVERISAANVRTDPGRAVLEVAVQALSGVEHFSVAFPPAHGDALREVHSVLARFSAPGHAVRRLYQQEDEGRSMEPCEARSRAGSWARLDGHQVVVSGPAGEGRVGAADVSTVEFMHSLVGCCLKFFSPAGRRATELSVSFEYPETPAFLAVYRGVRWLLGKPLPSEAKGAEPLTAAVGR
jgi:hypothetical protein